MFPHTGLNLITLWNDKTHVAPRLCRNAVTPEVRL